MATRTVSSVVSVFALSAGGASASVIASAAERSPSGPSLPLEQPAETFVALESPQRLADTRPGTETTDGAFSGDGEQAGGSTLMLATGGRAGVPGDAGAVALNLTAVEAADDGFITAYPCGDDRPLASNLNYAEGQTIAVGAIVRVGTFGNVCVHNSGTTNFIVDVSGYFPDSTYAALDQPQRFLDTREASATIDGMFERIGQRDADATLELEVASRGDVPSAPDPVVLTVTAEGAADAGYVTVHPCDGDRPTASNLNHGVGQTIANTAVSRVGADGNVCIYTDGATHVIADVAGTLPENSFGALDQPQRVLDTRSGGSTADDLFGGDGQRPEDSTLELDIAGRVGVPGEAGGAVLIVTAVDPDAGGFVTVFPSGTDTPTASNLNYVPDAAVANFVITRLGDDGSASLYTSATTHLVVDVVGWLPGAVTAGDGDVDGP